MINGMMHKISNVAILWDIENVTPASTDTLFIQGLSEYAESLGRVVTSYAYADWGQESYRKLGPLLALRHFRLAHVPRERKGKNSADMQLVSDTLELLRFHEHIDRYILITGDSDFRPLLLSLRKSGKHIHIVCDLKTAAQDLLALADSFTDYRYLVPSNDEDDEINDTVIDKNKMDKHYWFERLAEASDMLNKQHKTASFGPVKIKLKMLNPGFHENSLGYKRFSDFVMAALREGYIVLNKVDDDSEPTIQKAIDDTSTGKIDSLQFALNTLTICLKDMDKGKEPQYHGYHQIGLMLKQQGINLQNIGFARLKQFIQSAETRGLVEIRISEMQHYAKLVGGETTND
jgi:uncharacterized LabA/DUF88 family protein